MTYERVLERSPNRFLSLAGAARSARLAGDRDGARRLYERLLALAGDSNRTEITAARAETGAGNGRERVPIGRRAPIR